MVNTPKPRFWDRNINLPVFILVLVMSLVACSSNKGPNPERIDNWKKVRVEFPDKPLRLYGPDTDSGSFDYFTEEIVGEAQLSRSDYTASADDNVLVRGVSEDRNSLGYFGYAYYKANSDKLKAISIDNGNGCVKPTQATIENGAYTPLARPLFIYVNIESLGRPEVRAFVEFYMENAPELVSEVGYVPLNNSRYVSNLSEIGKVATSGQVSFSAENLTGEIEIDGSSTVFPVSEAVAEEFGKIHKKTRVNVGLSGTGGGFKRFVSGETDISNASRPIRETESLKATEHGIDFLQLRVGTDGITVVVHPQNDFIECLKVEELRKIWEPISGN